jgi:hypothetical protein
LKFYAVSVILAGMSDPDCLFHVGQVVFYRPSAHGYGWEAPGSMPTPGTAVKVSGIVGPYIEIEGWPHPGGGMYWTEFSPA